MDPSPADLVQDIGVPHEIPEDIFNPVVITATGEKHENVVISQERYQLYRRLYKTMVDNEIWLPCRSNRRLIKETIRSFERQYDDFEMSTAEALQQNGINIKVVKPFSHTPPRR